MNNRRLGKNNRRSEWKLNIKLCNEWNFQDAIGISLGNQMPGFPTFSSGLEEHQLLLTGWKVPLHLVQQIRNGLWVEVWFEYLIQIVEKLDIKRGRYLKTIIGDNLDNSTMLNFCACSLLVILVFILYLVFILFKYLVVRHFKVGEKLNLSLGPCYFS